MDKQKVTYKDTTYSSIRKAKKVLKFNRSDVTDLMRMGYSADEAVVKALEMKRERKEGDSKARHGASKPITVNGRRYSSMSAASRALKMSTTTLREYVKDQKSRNIIIKTRKW